MSFGNDHHTDAQRAVLALVDKHGASALGFRTNPQTNVVHAGSARSLVTRGALVEFLGNDNGPWVRRRKGFWDTTGATPNERTSNE
jgi:hypothetical protein